SRPRPRALLHLLFACDFVRRVHDGAGVARHREAAGDLVAGDNRRWTVALDRQRPADGVAFDRDRAVAAFHGHGRAEAVGRAAVAVPAELDVSGAFQQFGPSADAGPA